MNKHRVLFLCVHNSARSQMAATYMNHLAGESFEAESAGFSPAPINPLAIEVMKEEGIDISQNPISDVFKLIQQGRFYGYVITVCDESESEKCPIFPGVTQRLHWSFKNPAYFEGTYEEKIIKTREVRDQIKEKVQAFINNTK